MATQFKDVLVCWNSLQEQRKAAVQMYRFHMTTLAQTVLGGVGDVEKFAEGVQENIMGDSALLRSYIQDAAEKFPHVAEPDYVLADGEVLTVKCKYCKEHLGWRCPVNPNGYCEYDYQVRQPLGVECFHCGQPEERK